MPIAVRVAPGIGCPLNPKPSITRKTASIWLSVASAFITINMLLYTLRIREKYSALEVVELVLGALYLVLCSLHFVFLCTDGSFVYAGLCNTKQRSKDKELHSFRDPDTKDRQRLRQLRSRDICRRYKYSAPQRILL